MAADPPMSVLEQAAYIVAATCVVIALFSLGLLTMAQTDPHCTSGTMRRSVAFTVVALAAFVASLGAIAASASTGGP